MKAEDFVTHSFQVNEEIVIELWVTIMGSIRVSGRKKDSYSLLINWCAGKETKHVNYLLSKAEAAITGEDVPVIASRLKPYFNDEKFCTYLESLGTSERFSVTDQELQILRAKTFAAVLRSSKEGVKTQK